MKEISDLFAQLNSIKKSFKIVGILSKVFWSTYYIVLIALCFQVEVPGWLVNISYCSLVVIFITGTYLINVLYDSISASFEHLEAIITRFCIMLVLAGTFSVLTSAICLSFAKEHPFVSIVSLIITKVILACYSYYSVKSIAKDLN